MSTGRVWIVEGWFGDIEWIEGVYEFEDNAKAECERLWETRRSDHPSVPDWCQGLCKFDVSEYVFSDAAAVPSREEET